jgi:hypothetical protein
VSKEEAAADCEYFNDRERNRKKVDQTLKQILGPPTDPDVKG